MITRCPECHAWFRLRAEHLSVANGFVTCGDCDAVFNALTTLIDETASVEAPLAAPPAVTAEPIASAPREPALDDPVTEAPPPSLPASDPDDEWTDAAAQRAAASPDDDAIESVEPGATDVTGDMASEYAAPDMEAPAVLQSDLEALSRLPLRRGVGRHIWRGLVAALGIAAAAQIAWIYREELTTRVPQAEVVVAYLCGYVPCGAGAEREDGTIRLLARDVRDHPQYTEALLVNATMVNDAPSAQPFPVIELTLRNAVGNIMGARQFQPREYLDESISIEAGMPPERPIYVVMELGGGAVAAISFEFSFL